MAEFTYFFERGPLPGRDRGKGIGEELSAAERSLLLVEVADQVR